MKKQVKTQESTQPSITNCFLVGIDGSEGSHNAFDLVVNDLHRRGLDKIVLVHIFSEKDEEAGIQFHNKTIYNKYSEELKLKLKEADYEIVFQEKKEKENIFEQMNEIALEKNASLMVLGFRGKNGTKSRPDELSKGVTYLVHKPRIPVLIVKNNMLRSHKLENGFNWLCCLESSESKSFKALKTMVRFVNGENDTFTGITVRNKVSDKEVRIENEIETSIRENFEQQMRTFDIQNSSFKILEKEEDADVHNTIVRFISDSSKTPESFDIVICGYNPSKYAFNKEAVNTTVDLIKKCDINVVFDH